jgi:integrase
MLRNTPEWFRKKNIFDIEQFHVQKMINEYSENHSPKSTRNLHGLVASVLKLARPEIVLRTTLPENKPQDVYIPTDEEVKAILKEVKGTKYEVPLYLAVFGMRRSEICALAIDDLDGNMLSINKAKVQGPGEEWIIKETPKTAESNRKVYITDYVRDLILKQGYIYNGHPEHIKTKLENTEKALGIHHFSLHKMRHYFASMTHEMGLSDADIMAMGGWKTDNIMKTVYRHAIASSVSEGQRMYAEKIGQMQPA